MRQLSKRPDAKSGSENRRAGKSDELIGRRIRTLRGEGGLTQEGLAAMVGISCQQLQKYESGANRVSVSRLLEIADALQVDIAAMFDVHAGQVTGAEAEKSAEAELLLKHYFSIGSRQGRTKVIELAMFLASFEQGDTD